MNIFYNQKGSALIVVILLMGVLLSLSLYYLSISLTEKRIADSHFKGVRTYHLAEAGIEEMIWRLKNNETYKNNFESDPAWSASFTRNQPFGSDSGSYEVSIQNTGLAQGDIVSTSTIPTITGNLSQRVVKTKVYKAVSSSTDITDIGILGGNDIDIVLSDVNVSTSSIQANNDINVSGFGTDVVVDYDVRAVNDFNKSFYADVTAGGQILDSGDFPAPQEIEMPSVSFDDPGDPDSLKSRADIIYTEEEFEDLLDNSDGGSLVLDNDITYVQGDVIFDKDTDVTINGLLVADGDMVLGEPCWLLFCCGDHTNLTVNHEEGEPSGLIANGDITFDFCLRSSDLDGVIYATKDFTFTDFSEQVNINGGIFGREVGVFSVWQDLNIVYNYDYVNDSLKSTEFSPVVTVEHWEEEY